MGLKIIRDNVEQTMLETVALCQKMNVPLRCVYLALSESLKNTDAHLWQPPVINAIEKSLNDDENESILYICSDGDMMVLSRKTARKSFLRLLELLPRNFVPAPEIQGLAHLFELNIDGNLITKVCQEKINNEKKRQAELIQRKEQESITQHKNHERNMELDVALNMNLVSSLAARRIERKTPCILVVEDDLFSQRLVTNALRNKYEVCMATSGRDAIMSLIKHAPDMIFLDIELPDLTGIEILSEIFKIDAQAHVVMLSGNGSRENVMTAIQKGAKGFIGKPFTIEKLQQAIEKCPLIMEKRKSPVEING